MKRLGFVILVTAAMFMAVEVTGIAQAPRESIVVHGHWTLEVMNRDGSVADRREFDNALTPNGSTTLGELLSRRRTVGPWSILVQATSDIFLGNDAAFIAEGTGTDNGINFYGLSVGVDASGKKTVLIGKVTPTKAGEVRHVATYLIAPCAVSQCAAQTVTQFTATDIKNNSGVPTPLHLEADQTLRVTVTIGFSSPVGS